MNKEELKEEIEQEKLEIVYWLKGYASVIFGHKRLKEEVNKLYKLFGGK